jgi:hypothetical protein
VSARSAGRAIRSGLFTPFFPGNHIPKQLLQFPHLLRSTHLLKIAFDLAHSPPYSIASISLLSAPMERTLPWSKFHHLLPTKPKVEVYKLRHNSMPMLHHLLDEHLEFHSDTRAPLHHE